MLDLILPPKCLKCASRVDVAHSICPDCWKELQFLTGNKCACCGYPFGIDATVDYSLVGETLCGVCAKGPRHFDRAISALRYDDESRDMVIGFKHNDRTEYARYFTKLLQMAGKDLIEQSDIVAPVPLHKRRLLNRRYNQSALLSARLAFDAGLKHEPELLIRTKNTPPQQGNLNKRQKNVSGAFRMKVKKDIKDKNILLIDDVYTTGATVENCARVLKKAGAGSVNILTVFRVIAPQSLK
ncbi:ComF family protein [Pseudemcibacter aquimaris]|uniref:ComF family protein n=1 Tax=Pseudemcibacter aquimaris TaxID=2857064 RepID=UPI002010FA99|nr:ComF family protein [Pseudemcibacter aquimaris]MCC3861805.1 ComF family protein [Pseudemcibacter aquimaris]WDU58560.1 ComF family protein [Pseudemcibacter aquimaris]